MSDIETLTQLAKETNTLPPEHRLVCILLLEIVMQLRIIAIQLEHTNELHEFELGIDVPPEPEEEEAASHDGN